MCCDGEPRTGLVRREWEIMCNLIWCLAEYQIQFTRSVFVPQLFLFTTSAGFTHISVLSPAITFLPEKTRKPALFLTYFSQKVANTEAVFTENIFSSTAYGKLVFFSHYLSRWDLLTRAVSQMAQTPPCQSHMIVVQKQRDQ